ncbi:Glyoxalase/Bleomycin resistance protein/Dioxygenase superfamily-domain-containing protein [Truncatella angustata]|uniref:Glyoxalase/Bleomycin resistance protein/Dioxygenase superfamily-domain-containing protein n=1 Tax=Truncatella angustata TaxID=152316 RepID=A0A9P8UPQ6_9PEZI|nr:Glyoxalase/Bleomycin resistance protein/Dioxygenase superfamily-domain-containing protein [Truncatella angustata]KAH6656650.1 Glyoxalase/Bleomycin resistance protein/Dioxygenase superfamily-domain-containing protein [Truncatella angustata]KAH8199273.1 hypothetical protein TruAng_006556 [Truncatella angustata]
MASSPSARSSSMQVPSPILGSLNEICIVTPNLYKTLDSLTRLGLGPFRVFMFDSTTVPKQELRGKQGSDLYTMHVAFAQNPDPNEPVVEIIQPLTGQTSMQDYLDTHNNQEGVQHIAFNMEDLPMVERQKRMKERGIEPLMQGWWRGKKGETHFCFFDTVGKGLATCFETIEFSEDWEEPEFEWYPGPPVDDLKRSRTFGPSSGSGQGADGLEILL